MAVAILPIALLATPEPAAAAGPWQGDPCRYFKRLGERGRCTAGGQWRVSGNGGVTTYFRDGSSTSSFPAAPLPPMPPPPPPPPCPAGTTAGATTAVGDDGRSLVVGRDCIVYDKQGERP